MPGMSLHFAPKKDPRRILEAETTRHVKAFFVRRGWRPVRFQRTVIPGQFQTGEPGISDYFFVYYLQTDFPGLSVLCWVEMKRFHRGKLLEDQKKWIERERGRGAVVLKAENVAEVEVEYDRLFGWLQTEDWVKGQQRQMAFEPLSSKSMVGVSN